LKTKSGEPIVKLGATLNISFSLETSGELCKDKRWSTNTAEPIKGYVLESWGKSQIWRGWKSDRRAAE